MANSNEHNGSQSEIEKLRQALEEARQALVILNGAEATDRSELFNFSEHSDSHWKIDNDAAIAAIDRALE